MKQLFVVVAILMSVSLLTAAAETNNKATVKAAFVQVTYVAVPPQTGKTATALVVPSSIAVQPVYGVTRAALTLPPVAKPLPLPAVQAALPVKPAAR